jgi:hypothetical protein
MEPWSHYFHFPAGQPFEIDGPMGYNGQGKVLRNEGNTLEVRLDLPAWGPAPALHAIIELQYAQEGPGNRAEVRRDGAEPLVDANATIQSDEEKRERQISSSSLTCSVRAERKDKIEFEIQVLGKTWKFDFKR